MKYQRESFDEVLEEIKPLLEEHYQEAKAFPDQIPLDPYYEVYQAMDYTGNILIHTVRTDEDELVGYSITLLQMDPHAKESAIATNDMCYLLPDHRGSDNFKKLLQTVEADVKKTGASSLSYHFNFENAPKKKLEDLGYKQHQVTFAKYIQD